MHDTLGKMRENPHHYLEGISFFCNFVAQTDCLTLKNVCYELQDC